MTIVAFDLETHLVQPGLAAPPPVCVSYAVDNYEGAGLELVTPGCVSSILEADVIVGANVAFDMAVSMYHGLASVEQVFAAYEEGRVYDIQVAEALHAIAEGHLYRYPDGRPFTKGRYSLDRCVELVLGRTNAKENDFWRLRYALLENTPLDEWPEKAKQYPIDDAVNTLEVALAQRDGRNRNLHQVPAQTYAAFALHLASVWGIRTDGASVEALRERATAELGAWQERFTGVFLRANGSKDTAKVKRAVAEAYGASGTCPSCDGTGKVPSAKTGNPVNCRFCDASGLDLEKSSVPRTEKGGIACDRTTLSESGDDTLAEFGENRAKKIVETYIPVLESGVSRGISFRPNVLVESGRTSYDGVIQLIPKSGGVRECFTARPGYVFNSTDYSSNELCTLAQVCLWLVGWSDMAETINRTGDPGFLHTELAARMIGMEPAELDAARKAGDSKADGFRQAAKAANFGFPGGMGAATLVVAKRSANDGMTKGADGTEYTGIRFCILLGGAERCGDVKVTEWKGKEVAPTCRGCLEHAEELREAWFNQWSEIRPFFNHVSHTVDMVGEVEQLVSKRIRGGVTFTSAANGYFQGLASDGAKLAMQRVTREAYCDTDSPLYGSRPLFFLHDEIFSEMPEQGAHEASARKVTIMQDAMREFTPDVVSVAEPALMRRWSKKAGPVYKGGVLVPWEDAK